EYGLQLERSGRLDEAITVMERILLINPDHAEALNFIGYSWADTNRNLEKALDYINRAMQLKPDNGYIQDSLGWAYFRLGQLERAREELLGALVLLPNDPHIHEHLGDVYQALGLAEKARTAYEDAYEKFEDREKKEFMLQKIEALDVP
ncbi:MAG: tetratricopeptide repeat protein, partial [Deltaproteobacteria bacterium]|nr:tetratricopeptide repeat protein [Deltaproteobacteria bacterium]